jgi:2-keto-4-pentenoate hydratase
MEKMILKSGATVEAAFGARPLYEGDLILRVGSEFINTAATPMEALKAIDAAIPFIELPDLVYAKNVRINGPLLAAVNVAARYGVVGEPIPVQATPEWMERLKTFKCQIYDQSGKMLVEAPRQQPPGSPDQRGSLDPGFPQEGRYRAEEGDLLSLGTITKLTPTAPGTTVRARYVGLDPKGPAESP